MGLPYMPTFIPETSKYDIHGVSGIHTTSNSLPRRAALHQFCLPPYRTRLEELGHRIAMGESLLHQVGQVRHARGHDGVAHHDGQIASDRSDGRSYRFGADLTRTTGSKHRYERSKQLVTRSYERGRLVPSVPANCPSQLRDRTDFEGPGFGGSQKGGQRCR